MRDSDLCLLELWCGLYTFFGRSDAVYIETTVSTCTHPSLFTLTIIVCSYKTCGLIPLTSTPPYLSSVPITANIVSSNPAQTMCKRYNSM